MDSNEQENIISQEWVLGFLDRGLGRGNFGVITTKEDFVVGPCSKEIAEHIVKVHNDARNMKTNPNHKKTRSKNTKK